MFDIAPVFKRYIALLPLNALQAMRDRLEVDHSGSAAVKLAILHVSIEMLKRKWGCRA